MSDELEPRCGICGARGTAIVGAETAAPAVGCYCGVLVTGFSEREATERWNILSRRAEIGRLVEACGDHLALCNTTGCGEKHVRAQWSAVAHGKGGSGATLLDALRELEGRLRVND